MNQLHPVEVESVASLFYSQVQKYGEKAVAAYKKDNSYHDISWNELQEMVTDTAKYLLSCGIEKGDRVGVYSYTRFEWWVADLAILSIGAVTVPVHSTNSPEESFYVLDHSEAKACFVGNRNDLKSLLAVLGKLKSMKSVVSFDDLTESEDSIISLKKAMEEGRRSGVDEDVKERIENIAPEDHATYMYTSGTTGDPKGVMLTHGNFYSNVHQIDYEVGEYLTDDDVFLSFMPLSHSLERTCGYYFAIKAGCKVCFAEDFSTIAQDLQLVRPTVMISAPRIYEKVHGGILARVADMSAVKKGLFRFAINSGIKNIPYICENKTRKGLFALRYTIADALIFSKLRQAMGLDKLKFAISGGGPLGVSDAEFFLGMDLTILEGYGLTETTPVTNCNRPWKIKPGTVGPPVKDTDIRIDGDTGEIQIKGPQVMAGYFKNDAATGEAFTGDGYFKTGDIGVFDDDGFLRITGRIKDIIVTAAGKNISPQNIENSIKESKYIEQIAIIGDKRKYLSALVVPAIDEAKRWGSDTINSTKIDDIIKSDEFVSLIRREMDGCTKQYSRVEQIKKFILLTDEWTQATGEMTPSLKIKRRIIADKYSAIIDSMYQE